MSGHMHTHTHTHTHIHTYTHTHNNYYNPRCAHAHRGLMKTLKCKPLAQFAYKYTINVLSKCSNIISHRSSVFEGQHNDHRSSKVDTLIFESRHIEFRRSTHRPSIFEDRRWKHRADNPTSHQHSNNSSPIIVHNDAP